MLDSKLAYALLDPSECRRDLCPGVGSACNPTTRRHGWQSCRSTQAPHTSTMAYWAIFPLRFAQTAASNPSAMTRGLLSNQ